MKYRKKPVVIEAAVDKACDTARQQEDAKS